MKFSEVEPFILKEKKKKKKKRIPFLKRLCRKINLLIKNDPEERRKFKQIKTDVYGKVVVSLVKNANMTGIPLYLKRKNQNKSYVNLSYPDFSYYFVNQFKITSQSKLENSSYFCSFLNKVIYETPENMLKHLEAMFPKFCDHGIEFFKVVKTSNDVHNTLALVTKFTNSDVIFVVFRGSQFFSQKDWETDFKMTLRYPFEDKSLGVFEGAYDALFRTGKDGETVFSKVSDVLNQIHQPGKTKIICSGHSLGGVLASSFAICSRLKGLEYTQNNGIDKIITFGSMRVGTKQFVQIYSDICTRYVHDLDLASFVPEFMFPHGKEILITNVLPVRFQSFIRRTFGLPFFAINISSYTAHLPGGYLIDLCKKHNFPVCKRSWKVHLRDYVQSVLLAQ